MVKRGKQRVLMSGLGSIAVPFNRNGSVKDAKKVKLLNLNYFLHFL